MPITDLASSQESAPQVPAETADSATSQPRARDAGGKFIPGVTAADLDTFKAAWPEKYAELYGKQETGKEPDHPLVAAMNEATEREKKTRKPAAPAKAADAQADQQTKPEAQDAPKAVAADKGTATESSRDKAVKALKLDGYTDSMIAKLDETEVLALGAKSTEQHKEFERLRIQARKSEKQTANEKPVESAPRQLDEESRALVKELESEIGSEKAGKALEKLLLRANERVEQIQLDLLERDMASTRADLGEHLSGLSDDGVFSDVVDEMEDLYRTKRYSGKPLSEVMQAAYRNVVPEPSASELESERLQKQGTSAAPAIAPRKAGSSEIDPRTLSKEKLVEWIFHELEAGRDHAEVTAQAGY